MRMTSGSSSQIEHARSVQNVVRSNSRQRAVILVASSALAALAWAGFAPIRVPSNEAIFEIPPDTWARRMVGDSAEILPDEIRLTLGVRDVLVLRNRDHVPQVFGPTLLLPGQSFRLPFAVASRYNFACTAHASGQMTIIVEPKPVTPWARIHWRTQEFVTRVRQ
jgi:hypothetical protein